MESAPELGEPGQWHGEVEGAVEAAGYEIWGKDRGADLVFRPMPRVLATWSDGMRVRCSETKNLFELLRQALQHS